MAPSLVRRVILPLHERLCGRDTLGYARDLEVTQWWPADRLRELQTHKLRALLTSAARHSSFFRERISKARFDPARATLDDLHRIAPLTKSDIRQNLDCLAWPAVPGGLHRASTGGSTGAPISFYMDRARQAADQAARIRSRRWFGVEPGDRELYLWGSPVELTAQDRAKTFRDRLMNHRLLNAFEMTTERIRDYVEKLSRFNPVHLFGYPSSLSRLVATARASARHPAAPALRAVFVTGEWLDPADRAAIAEWFRVPVANGYGAREAGFIAHECPQSRLHVTDESLIVELIDASGQPVADGEPGEVIVTHLDNLGMPLIRYRTGDIARRDAEPCPCGRQLSALQQVEGRRTDQLLRKDGGHAHALSVIYVLRETPGIREFKVIQRAGLDLDVALVPDREFDRVDQTSLANRIGRQLGGVDVRLRLVDQIAPEKSGKFRYVVSEAVDQPEETAK